MTHWDVVSPVNRRVLAAVILTFVSMCLAGGSDAWAHGESAQAADMRLRAIHWYDARSSTQTVEINQSVILTGKFLLSADWPEMLPSPEQAVLHTGSPETGLIRVRTEINGIAQSRPMRLEPGRSYAYEIEMRAREPGRAHVHPVLHFGGGASLTGPGHWLEVAGDPSQFVRFEASGVGSEFGEAAESSSNGLAVYTLWGLLALFCFGAAAAVSRWLHMHWSFWVFTGLPAVALAVFGALGSLNRVPLGSPSAQTVPVDQMESRAEALSVKLIDAVYSVPARSLAMQMEVTNGTSRNLELGEFTIAYARFLNPAVEGPLKTSGPNAAVSLQGLSTTGAPIAAGETKRLQVAARDVIWETERFMELNGAGRHKFSALLHFFAPTGERRLHEIVGELSLEYQ